MSPFRTETFFRAACKSAATVFVTALALIHFPTATFGGPPPRDWQISGFGARWVLVTNAVVDYDAGTWNVKPAARSHAIVCKSLSGDFSVVMKITDATGAGTTRIGIMTWSSLAITAGKAGLMTDPQGQKIYFTWDEASDRGGIYANFVQMEGLGFPLWLRLTRSGSSFSAHYSKDGTEWRQVGVPVKTFWAGKRPEMYAGAYNDGNEARFTNLEITKPAEVPASTLPEGWTSEVQGQPAFVGEARHADGKWTLAGATASGRGGYHNVTAMRSVPSKVQLTVKVRLADLSDPYAGGGLLLSAHGIDVGMLAMPAGGKMQFYSRQSSTGRGLQSRTTPIPATLVGQAEAYLRLALVDGRVAGFFGASTNGMTQVGEVLTVTELAADVSGGLEMFCNSGSRTMSAASFEDFQAEPITALPGQPLPAVRDPQIDTLPKTPPVARQTPPTQYPTYPEPRRSSSGGSALGGFLCVGAIIIGLLTVFLIKPFNRLVYLRNRVKKAWAQIDVQLKRRHDLILNYVEAVKGYAKHESGTLEGVAKARSAAVNATSVDEKAKAEAALNASMRSIYAVVESYPELKANQNFLSLQGQLRETEDKLAGARNEYNEDVLTYNTQVQSFPTNIIALVFRFKASDFFELKEADQREAPKVTS